MENRYVDSHLRKDISQNKHRQVIGGLWNELGPLQFNYMKEQGLTPSNSLIDVGCGSFRGGTLFIPYLAAGNYYGFDINRKLIDAGLENEVSAEDRKHKVKHKNFHAANDFDLPSHWSNIDAALSVSLFTHLTLNSIRLCLAQTHKVLKKGALYHSTVFITHNASVTLPCEQGMNIVTQSHQDPYHYTEADLDYIATSSGYDLVSIKDFGHPRHQKMAVFKRL